MHESLTPVMSKVNEIVSAVRELDSIVMEYIQGVLKDFSLEDAHRNIEESDIYDAVGIFLEDAKLSEEAIKAFCKQVASHVSDNSNNQIISLEVPTSMLDFEDNSLLGRSNIDLTFIAGKKGLSHVNKKELEKAELKQKLKQERREKKEVIKQSAVAYDGSLMEETEGSGRIRDIRIENFDIAIGGKRILTNADLSLAFGRRYGLVGRNGIGKSTLLRYISSRQLSIPKNISILHVEQEVVGNEVTAIQSVLDSDLQLVGLLKEEKQLLELLKEESTEEEKSKANERLIIVYAKLELIEADKAESRASSILSGLGFSNEDQRKATKTFSGGWRMRLSLARALYCKPDLLLLDEPTNMLDIPAVIWLENYLETWPKTILVVSHDRQFLDVVSTDVIHLHHETLDAYKGNYSQFVLTREERLKNYQKEYENQMVYRAHLQAFIDRWRYNANRAAQAQSKIKILEKLEDLKPIPTEPTIHFQFPPVESLSPPIIQMDGVTFGYDESRIILSKVNFNLDLSSRIAIVGPNGAGKTTLLKLLTGSLEPSVGICHRHGRLRFAFFSQHHVDQLTMGVNSVEFMAQKFPGRTDEEYRRHLGSFGISGPLGLQSIQTLSGGQKSRVVFATMNMLNPHVLILDEPTNHLDMDSIDALVKAVKVFEGGVVVVSHDERFIKACCNDIFVCDGGSVRKYPGEIEDYVKSLL